MELKTEKQFTYYESNPGKEPMVLLHGLMGALSNFEGIVNGFGKEYNVLVPILPIFELPTKELTLEALVNYIEDFVAYKGFDKIHVLGNSLGGHLAQLYTLSNQEKVKTMILTGSSGLFESAMGNSYPRKGDYEYIKQKAEDTFYDPKTATKELVDELFEVISDREKALRIIITAKSAVRNNLEDLLDGIKVPTLLIWGAQDGVTPPFVADKFNELLPDSKLVWVDKCGHAPMMEHPEEFNKILGEFLRDRA